MSCSPRAKLGTIKQKRDKNTASAKLTLFVRIIRLDNFLAIADDRPRRPMPMSSSPNQNLCAVTTVTMILSIEALIYRLLSNHLSLDLFSSLDFLQQATDGNDRHRESLWESEQGIRKLFSLTTKRGENGGGSLQTGLAPSPFTHSKKCVRRARCACDNAHAQLHLSQRLKDADAGGGETANRTTNW